MTIELWIDSSLESEATSRPPTPLWKKLWIDSSLESEATDYAE